MGLVMCPVMGLVMGLVMGPVTRVGGPAETGPPNPPLRRFRRDRR
jgi:hypothetical protein